MTKTLNDNQTDRTNSMGLWTYSKEFLNAAKAVASLSDKELVPIPAYYLVCHSIELILKAFLRGEGESLNKLREVSHDLNQALKAAKKKNLDQYYLLTEDQREAVDLINDYYNKKELEYITTGFKSFPKYDILEKIASSLIDSLERFCLSNRNLHDKTI